MRIRKNPIKLIALILAALLPFVAVLGIAVFAPPVYGQTFLGELSPKYDRLTAIDEQKLVVVGGGHVGNSVLRTAKAVGFHTTLVDTRGEDVIGDSIRMADRFISVKNFADVEHCDLPKGASFVVSTYGHMVDGAALGGVLRRDDAAYIGMLGSRQKIRAIFEKLRGEGIPQEKLAPIHTPIGLDLGGETPEEIGLAVVAEILAVKNGRTGGFLKI